MFDTVLVIGVGITVCLALAGWLARHITNNNKHPCKSDIVVKDVCEIKHKGLEDCIENQLKSHTQRLDELRLDMKEAFTEIKVLIKNNK